MPGVKLLERAAERLGGNSTAVISLVEIYRSLGKNEEALAAARKAARRRPRRTRSTRSTWRS